MEYKLFIKLCKVSASILILCFSLSCEKNHDPTVAPNISVSNGPNINDIVGNSYKTVIVGGQQWMAENLRTTKYNDGTPIPIVKDNIQWANNKVNNTKLPMMTWYDNDSAKYSANKFGAVYNYYAINLTTNGNKNVCPTGWHMPSDDEWTILANYLGGHSIAGGRMKEAGTANWISPNIGATNDAMFSVLPGGFRNYDGKFVSKGVYIEYWSTTEKSDSEAWDTECDTGTDDLGRDEADKRNGFYCRCIKN